MREVTALPSNLVKEGGRGGFRGFNDGTVVGSGGRSGEGTTRFVKAR